MKHHIFVKRDKKLGCYHVPEFTRDDKETYTEGTIRGLKLIDRADIARAADHSLYYLGYFDDLEGKFYLVEKEDKLIDFEDYVPRKVGESNE